MKKLPSKVAHYRPPIFFQYWPGCPNQPRIDFLYYKYVLRLICLLICGGPYELINLKILVIFELCTRIKSICFQKVIYASDIGPSVNTFGWSISAGMDLDGNQYPDILVGAYESNNAVYLKSLPVINLGTYTIYIKLLKLTNDSLTKYLGINYFPEIFQRKAEKILKGSLDLIPSPSVNIQTGLYSNHGQESLLEL